MAGLFWQLCPKVGARIPDNAPASPFPGDYWIVPNRRKFATRQWDGGRWVDVPNPLTNSADGAVCFPAGTFHVTGRLPHTGICGAGPGATFISFSGESSLDIS
jgi:hypothetical protein